MENSCWLHGLPVRRPKLTNKFHEPQTHGILVPWNFSQVMNLFLVLDLTVLLFLSQRVESYTSSMDQILGIKRERSLCRGSQLELLIRPCYKSGPRKRKRYVVYVALKYVVQPTLSYQ